MAIETYFEDIADAIRERGGTSATLTPAQMPQAILDIPGGGGGGVVKMAEWDFSVSGTDSINNFSVATSYVTALSTGYQLTASNSVIRLPYDLRNSSFFYEIDIGSMSLSTPLSHQRFFMFTDNSGFIFRNNGHWSFYQGSGWATDSSLTSFDYFANSKMGIYIDIKNSWHIYKDGVLVYEPDRFYALQQSTYQLTIGSPGGQSAYTELIKGLTVYNGNPYA